MQSKIAAWLSRQALVEGLFLEDMRGGDGAAEEVLYPIFTFEPSHNLPLPVSGLLKLCLVQYLSFGET